MSSVSSALHPIIVDKPITPRQNLATVTYPVSLATDGQVNRSDTGGLYNIPTHNRIDQYAILLTRKDQHLRPGSKRIGVFSRLNKIACKDSRAVSKEQKRSALLKELRFAGIAHSGVSEEFASDGSPGQIAAIIGGSHTVMSYRHDHAHTPMHPGTRVRWTLPAVEDRTNPTKPPVTYLGDCSTGVFAELEEIDESNTAREVLAELGGGTSVNLTDITKIIKILNEMNEREIGTVICDNNQGSVDIRLK